MVASQIGMYLDEWPVGIDDQIDTWAAQMPYEMSAHDRVRKAYRKKLKALKEKRKIEAEKKAAKKRQKIMELRRRYGPPREYRWPPCVTERIVYRGYDPLLETTIERHDRVNFEYAMLRMEVN